MVVVATEEEYKIAKKRWKYQIVIKTGVGGINVIKKLKRIPKWVKIINFGYVGSKTLPIGTTVEIGTCAKYHPNTNFDEPVFHLKGQTWCYTQDDYVSPNEKLNNTVYDMELAYICALGFKNIKSIKIVSDNCNQKEYYNFIEKGNKENDRKSKSKSSR